ncbi:restriction endonuclease subunit S [Streptomyces goshikiensis]
MAGMEHRPLGQLLRRPPRYGINAAAVPLTPGVATYIRITDIDDSGRFSPDPKVGVDHVNAAEYRLSAGELVFARTGATVGKSYLYDPRDGKLVYAGFLINVAPDPERLNPKFLSLFVQSKEYWDWVARTSVRSGQPGINGREYAQLSVPLPDIATQNTIAAAMNDVDDLISTLERLIVKKQAIKQGMLQKLLTGKTTLRGSLVSGGDATLGSITTWLSGGTPDRNNPTYWDGTIPWISAATLKCSRVHDSDQHLTEAGVRAGSKLAPAGAALVLVRGMALHREARIGMATRPVSFNQDVKALIPKPGVLPEFLLYALQARSAQVLDLVSSAGSGTGVLDTQLLQRLPVWLPDASTQRKIVTAIEAIDRNIEVFARLLAKIQVTKQGMTQQLLTGRSCLPVKEGVE